MIRPAVVTLSFGKNTCDVIFLPLHGYQAVGQVCAESTPDLWLLLCFWLFPKLACVPLGFCGKHEITRNLLAGKHQPKKSPGY